MIADIKTYACATVIVVLLTAFGMTKWQLHSVEKEYKTYKESINDQLQKAKIEKARIEAEQKAKHDREIADYAADLDRLNRILAGLRKSSVVSGNEALRVAGDSSGSMSREAESDSGLAKASEVEACVRRSTFFSEALKDTLQCSRLIEFVSK